MHSTFSIPASVKAGFPVNRILETLFMEVIGVVELEGKFSEELILTRLQFCISHWENGGS